MTFVSPDKDRFRRVLQRTLVWPLLLVVALAILFAWQLNRLIAVSLSVDRTDQTIAQANLVQKLFLDMETGLRGYLVTGNDGFLKPYTDSSRVVDREMGSLGRFVSANKAQEQRVDAVRAGAAAWRAYAAQAISRRETGGNYRSVESEMRGKSEMDGIRGQITQIVYTEAALRNQREADARRAATATATAGVGSLVMATFIMAFYGRRAVSRLGDSYADALRSTQDQAQSLYLSEQRYATTLTSIGDAVIATDAQEGVTFMNPVAEELTAWRLSEAKGLPVDDVFHIVNEDTRTPVPSPVSLALRSGEVQGLANHTILISRNGREVPIDDSGAPIRDSEGAITGAVLVFRDVSRRREAEQALAASEARVHRLMDSGVLGVITADIDGRFLEANDAFLRMTGYTREDLLQGHVRWDEMTPPEWAHVNAKSLRQLAEQGVTEPYEKEYFRKDGSRVPVSVGAAMVGGDSRLLVAYIMDLTQLRRAEQEREAANRRIVSIFESISEAFFAVDREWRFTYMNSQGERLIQVNRDEAIGKNVWEIFPEAVGTTFYEEYHRAMRENTPVRFVEYFEALESWFDVHAYPSPDGLSVYFNNVNEHRTAEDALKRSEDRYRSLVEASTQIVWTTDPAGAVDDMPTWRDFTGQTREEVRGSGWLDALCPDDRAKTEETWFVAVSKRSPYSCEYRLRRADGVYRHMLARGVPVLDSNGDIREWVGTCSDITDIKAAEASTARRGRQLEILSHASQGINSVLETSTILRMVTQAAIDVSGAEGGGAGIVQDGHVVFMESNRRGVWSAIPTRYAPGQGITGHVMTTRQPYVSNDAANDPLLDPGSIASLGMRNVANIPILSRDGEMLGDFAVYNTDGDRPFDEQDVTILQGLSASAATALENTRLLAERAQVEEALREADRAKDQFLAVLSHELRNPVAAIANAVYLLKQIGSLDPRTARARDAIERAAANQARLLEDLLDVSRITQGKITLQRKRIALDESAAAIVRSLRLQADGKGLRLRFDADQNVYVNVDPTRMDQIISNLVVNAIKYTEHGSISVSVRRSDGNAVLRVRDTGIGVAPDMLPSIFDMFSQADSSLAHASGGLGVGLALVRSLVQMHGGSVEAQSDGLGHGAAFTVCLPLAAESAETTGAPASNGAHPAPGRSNLHILLVDDNEDARETLKDILEMDGYVIITAGDGLAAVEAADRERPDAILLDIGLPGMDGYEAARRIRSNPRNEGVYIVALTGYGQPSDKDRAREAGCDEHLTKPVDIASLQSLLSRPR